MSHCKSSLKRPFPRLKLGQGAAIVALSGLVFGFACTKDSEGETEPAESRSVQHIEPQNSQPNAGVPKFIDQQNQVPTNKVAVPEFAPGQEPELACQPLPWPEARKTARRNTTNRGAGPRRRGMPGGAFDMDDGSGFGAVARESAAKGGMAPSAAVAGKSSAAAPAPSAAPAAKSKRVALGSSKDFGGRGPVGGFADSRVHSRSGLLTAGEWRDLDHWGFWRGLFNTKRQGTSEWQGMQKQWGFSLRNRVSLTVKAGDTVAPNVSVYLYDNAGKTAWKARSDNQGEVHLFPQWHKGPFSVCAAVEGAATKQVNVELSKGVAALEVGLQAKSNTSNGLDVMFMVDTTGSMGDELSYLQSELRNVISRVEDANANADIRTSVNFYRDTTDEYVVRPFAFTRDVKQARKQIAAQSANGGGDFPEAVDAGLTNAIFEHKWREDARARILFLVLDAPPHQEKKTLARVRRAVRQAAEQGIRIVPIAGSGIDKPTEFLMRFLAVATGGTYAFLTDDSGIGNSHLKPTIGKHKVQKLNRLLTNIINRYAE